MDLNKEAFKPLLKDAIFLKMAIYSIFQTYFKA